MNRLAAATSPYLLQHADNPVDWYEWGEDAFAAARTRDVPILLSVGYSACHWCHVMAHESFEDVETADMMNRLFVNVKVDREERPDVDRIYMDAVVAMNGHGGWPMTVILTPEGLPFFAGTYFPKEDRGHHPSFKRVLAAIQDAWTNRRSELSEQAAKLTESLRASIPPSDSAPGGDAATLAVSNLSGQFDNEWGGFGGAPKFPQAPTLELLLRAAATGNAEAARMLRLTLERMHRGGIYDHVDGGFARYAVDRVWLVPHFEKMLYDNALLARIYLRAGQVLDDSSLIAVAVETLDYLLVRMTDDGGGFYSAEDADSEGVEGKFYVYSWQEFAEAAPRHVQALADLHGVSPGGNFEGSNIIHLAEDLAAVATRHGLEVEDLEDASRTAVRRLGELRSERVRPGLDDKVITAWNGFAMRAFAEAGAVLDEPRFLTAAKDNARFILTHLRRPDGRILRSWRGGASTIPGYCEDYASLAIGLFTLFAAAGAPEHYAAARSLVIDMIDLFGKEDGIGFYSTGTDAEKLITRPQNLMDNPTPGDNSLAAEAMWLLSMYDGPHVEGHDLGALINGTLRAAGRIIERAPSAIGHLIAVHHAMHSDPVEVAIVGPDGDTRPMRTLMWSKYRPATVVALDSGAGENAHVPLMSGRTPEDQGPRAYVCRGFTCEAPVSTAQALGALLDT